MADGMADFGMVRDWQYRPSPRTFTTAWRERRLRLLAKKTPPEFFGVKQISGPGPWAVYFIWAPDCALRPSHVFTLERLRDEGFKVAVICSTSRPGIFPPSLEQYTDALYWKAGDGYDFSAYSIGLREIVMYAEGSDVLVLNDSIFGPFHPIRPLIDDKPWDLIGFTASRAFENHLQSYAFFYRSFDKRKWDALQAVFPTGHSFNVIEPVVYCQEIPHARTAHQTMSVGALWYPSTDAVDDPGLNVPFDLVGAGHPFLKRSLVGKFSGRVKAEDVADCLRQYRHPVPSATALASMA